MEYSEARPGRTFILRLEDGEILHEEIEKFARRHSIAAASVLVVGGADKNSKLITGPQHGRRHPVTPMQHTLPDVHEAAGVGTIFPDETGKPVLHLHMACGRQSSTITGCVRSGVTVWHIMEVIIAEITGSQAARVHDAETGFKLLKVGTDNG